MDVTFLSNALITYSTSQNIDFTLRGSNITYEEVFSPVGLLPAMAKRADQIASLCFGYGIGVDLPKQEKTTAGYTLTIRENAPPFIIALCVFDVLEEIIKNASNKQKVALDDLLYE
jgi:intracellular multiplication protein IcmS